ncbi:Putative type II secretion system protein [Saliniradius amylolyticus]|uniref:Type II secretion system protein n=1 Tax=Saliniradius amylolyticus TaxID=2183582 RepID=A0A2S2E181_9ALTE|nr:type II secretion system F family protein [Saliniradius amylolyticus]AWL10787.1 Putative type II secretion system protein [Saliniradius amylolyticus]
MAKYKYNARNQGGELVKGIMDASDHDAVAKYLRDQGLIPLDVMEERQPTQVGNVGAWFRGRVSLDELVIFSRQMYSLTKAGIPIIRALEGIASTTTNKRLKTALEDAVDQLGRGRNLSTAFNRHPDIFNQLYVSVVHVGENTGQLDESFLSLTQYLSREQETRKQIASAIRYPIFVMFAIGVALVIMNIFVIPTFANMFSRLGAELPPMTQFLIGMSNLFVHYWYLLILALIVGIFAVRQYLNTDYGRESWDKRKLRLYAVGSIMERSLLSRFARSFTLMLRAGIPMTYALSLVSDSVDNAHMSKRISEMRKNIEKGESLSKVCKKSGLFTPLVLQMIAVGEEIGQVDVLLRDVADFYEREVEYDLKALTSKIEPILIAIVSVMVLVLALGIFTPMWDMMGAFKG